MPFSPRAIFSNFGNFGNTDLQGWTSVGGIGLGGRLSPGVTQPPDDSFRVQGGLGGFMDSISSLFGSSGPGKTGQAAKQPLVEYMSKLGLYAEYQASSFDASAQGAADFLASKGISINEAASAGGYNRALTSGLVQSALGARTAPSSAGTSVGGWLSNLFGGSSTGGSQTGSMALPGGNAGMSLMPVVLIGAVAAGGYYMFKGKPRRGRRRRR